MKRGEGISKFYFFTEIFEHCWNLLNIIELCWTSWPVELNLKRFLHFTFLQNLLNIVEPCWTLSIWILLKILTSWVEFEEMKGEEAFTFPQNLPPDISDALPTKIERTIVSALLNPIPNSSFRKLRKKQWHFFLAAESLSRPEPLLWVPHSWAKRADHVQWGPGEPFRAIITYCELSEFRFIFKHAVNNSI